MSEWEVKLPINAIMFLLCSEKQGDFFCVGNERENKRSLFTLLPDRSCPKLGFSHKHYNNLASKNIHTLIYMRCVHMHHEITWVTFLQSSLGPLLKLFFWTTLIRNKLNVLKGNKIVIKFRVHLKALSSFGGNNLTSDILYAFSPVGLDLYSIK